MEVLIFSYLERYYQQPFKRASQKILRRYFSMVCRFKGGEWHPFWHLLIDTVAISRYTSYIFFWVGLYCECFPVMQGFQGGFFCVFIYVAPPGDCFSHFSFLINSGHKFIGFYWFIQMHCHKSYYFTKQYKLIHLFYEAGIDSQYMDII